MRYLILAAALALGACASGTSSIPTSPGQVADQTVLDEKLAITAEATYAAAREAIEVAVDAGVLVGSSAARAALIDQAAYAGLQRVRAAYRAGNAASYDAAYRESMGLIADLVSLIR